MCDEIAGRRDHDANSKFKASASPVSALSKRNLKKCRKFKQKYCNFSKKHENILYILIAQ
ncbi:hypothetical protein PZ07_06485 [Lacticaseibacillus rhamnosus]|nr:hypothetical protein PZ07_06485 [Lacticaseibacillus rhamnosus]